MPKVRKSSLSVCCSNFINVKNLGFPVTPTNFNAFRIKNLKIISQCTSRNLLKTMLIAFWKRGHRGCFAATGQG